MRPNFILVVLLFLLFNGCTSPQKPADLLIVGKIYTAEESNPLVEAVAVNGNKIVFAGALKDAERYKGDRTEVLELGQNVMTPGFIEGHAHLLGIGYNEMNLDLSQTKSYEEIVEKVAEAVKSAQPGQWIVGRGWHQDKWSQKPEQLVNGFQTHHLLSEVSPENPVFLTHASGHTAIANQKAMELAGVTLLAKEQKHTPETETEGGEILRDALGNPTGIFSENAMTLIEQHIPAADAKSDSLAIELATAACLRNGITSLHDAGAADKTIELYYRFRKADKLQLRLYVMLENNRALLNKWYQKGPDVDPENWLTVRAIKIYGDGALGSRGAWLLEPYADRPDFSGMATVSMDTVLKIAEEGLVQGFQVCTHAIGDRANREILNRYEQAFASSPEKAKDHRFRIEHAQHLHPSDIPRFGKLGVIPSMQAIHMSSDRPWAIDRLGEKRIEEGAYVWQSLIQSGAVVVNGTDAPVEPLNPLACFYASISRKTLQGTPENGYEANEKMTREQALRAYTINGAFAAFQEDIKGSITVGKLADFTVFSKDIMSVPEEDILSTSVVMTIIDGKIVYRRK